MIASFPFAVDSSLSPIARLFLVEPATAVVQLDATTLTIRFGVWKMRVPLDEVAGTSITGPYRRWRVAGGPRLSLEDGGVTFATSIDRGLCIRFRRPQRAPWPGGRPRVPAATVTVTDPEGLAEMLALRVTASD